MAVEWQKLHLKSSIFALDTAVTVEYTFLSCNIFTFVAKILYFVATFLVKSQKMKVVPYNALLYPENCNEKYEELTEIMSKMYVKMVKFFRTVFGV